jgi:hypothetical protein
LLSDYISARGHPTEMGYARWEDAMVKVIKYHLGEMKKESPELFMKQAETVQLPYGNNPGTPETKVERVEKRPVVSEPERKELKPAVNVGRTKPVPGSPKKRTTKGSVRPRNPEMAGSTQQPPALSEIEQEADDTRQPLKLEEPTDVQENNEEGSDNNKPEEPTNEEANEDEGDDTNMELKPETTGKVSTQKKILKQGTSQEPKVKGGGTKPVPVSPKKTTTKGSVRPQNPEMAGGTQLPPALGEIEQEADVTQQQPKPKKRPSPIVVEADEEQDEETAVEGDEDTAEEGEKEIPGEDRLENADEGDDDDGGEAKTGEGDEVAEGATEETGEDLDEEDNDDTE